VSAGPLLAALEPSARGDALRLAAELEAAGGSACLLGPQGEILYVNDGWDRFALENDGGPGARGEQLLGKRYASFVNGLEARSFFEGLWLRVVAGQPVAYRADCNSAQARRELSTSFTPVRLGTSFGAVVVHSILEVDASRRPQPSGEPAWTR
jgi:hypothetical protein